MQNEKGKAMRRVSRVLLTAALLASAGSAPARPDQAPTEETPPPPASAPAATPPATTPPDPLQEFVPREKLKADSVVALPVDI
jgi:hypothetical protein